MLKQTISETLHLFETPDLADLAKQLGLDAGVYPQNESVIIDLSGKKIVVFSDVNAERKAVELCERGLDPATVQWVDERVAPQGFELFLRENYANIWGKSKDIYWSEVCPLFDAVESEENLVRYDSGVDGFENHLKWRSRELVILAGPYGCGKSTLSQILALHWAYSGGGKDREIPVWFCTWEDDPIEQRDQILRYFTNGNCNDASLYQIKTAEAMQKKILHTRPELARDRLLSWYMERAKYFNKKHGTNFFVLDPWSEFDHIRSNDISETQYVKEVMKTFGKLRNEIDAVFCIVTHISAKMYSEDGKIKPFRVANAFGSVQFGSSADRGICVLRTGDLMGPGEHMVVRFDKVKVERTMGRKGTVALCYDEQRHVLYKDSEATAEAQEAWK